MKNIKDLTKEEVNIAINIFKARKDLRNEIGGCPPDDIRVPDKTNCFYCDECWIAVLENIKETRIKYAYIKPNEICEYGHGCNGDRSDCLGKDTQRTSNFSCGLRRGLLIADGHSITWVDKI